MILKICWFLHALFFMCAYSCVIAVGYIKSVFIFIISTFPMLHGIVRIHRNILNGVLYGSVGG